MKRTALALILFLSSFSCLTAQCVVNVDDTLGVVCGGSVQIHSTSEPVFVSSPTTNTLNQIQFRDPSNSYIAGENGTLLRSADGGQNWALTTFLPDQNWKSVSFSSDQTGFMVSAGGKIAKTTDGGVTWNVIFDDPAKHFTRVRFINATTGFAIGEQGLILKTTDGNTWNPIAAGTSARMNDIVFVNQVKGFIAGDYDYVNNTNIFLTSSDGGNSWVNSVVEAGYNMYTSIAFANENVGYVSGSYNTFRTTNGGNSWEPACWSADIGIASQDDSTVFLCNFSDIYKFTVGSFVPEDFASVFPRTFHDITCPDNQSMFAVGTDGLILSYHAPVSYQWEPSAGLNAANVPSPIATPRQTTTYNVTVQLSNGTFCTDSVLVMVVRQWFIPDLCMVTVDSATSHNRIIWNKPGLSTADSVYLYKEGSVSGQYTRLAGYSALLPGEYIDEQSNAVVRAETYALKVVDKCSFESDLGFGHSPVHLSINQGVGSTCNLIWEPYQGAEVFTYNLYRSTALGNPELIASVSGSSTQYTDLNPPSGETNYLVEAMLNVNCSVRTGGTSSLSNLARYSSYPHGIGDDRLPGDLRISDNPVTGHFTVNESKLSDIASISLMSLNGKPVEVWNNPSISSFDISWLASGIYVLKINLKSSQISFMQKLVKL